MNEKPSKITITSYTDKELTQRDRSVEPYSVPVNPEQYSMSYKIDYEATPASGAQGVQERFKSSLPEELKLDWIIDGTNTIYGYKYSTSSARTVSEQIQHLKSVVYDMSGEIHQPRFLKIMGLGIHQRGKGDVTFDGIMKELQITFTLFSPDGEPLRAKISATFLDFRENKRRVLEEGKESPDLTYVHTVSEGEKFPLIVYNKYKDPTYHLEVAKVNNLTNFRRLDVGRQIILPPIEKVVK
jgi:hypothetical protein